MTANDNEIARYELQTAKGVWEALSPDNRALLLSVPVGKEIKNDSVSPNEFPKGIDRPEFDELIKLGLVVEAYQENKSQYVSMGGLHSLPFYSPMYYPTTFGGIVARYGRATITLELANQSTQIEH